MHREVETDKKATTSSAGAAGSRTGRRARNLKRMLGVAVVTGLLTPAAAWAIGGFHTPVSYPTGIYPLCVIQADVNLDGYAEVIVAEAGDSAISILTNDGGGGLARRNRIPVGIDPVWVAAADVNGDSYPDLAVADEKSNGVFVLLNNRSGTFGSPKSYPVHVPVTVALDDVSGDGKPDLVAVSQLDEEVSVFHGNGSGGFGTRRDYPVGDSPRSLAIGDLNGDGKRDVATVNYGDEGNCVSILMNDGSGGFSPAIDKYTGSNPWSVAMGDVNGDGSNDLVVANSLGKQMALLLNNGFGVFSYGTAIPCGLYPKHVALADLNGDGRLDLAVADYKENTLSVLAGDGTGRFTANGTIPVGAGPWSFAVGDLDGDAKNDIVTANRNANAVSVLLTESNALRTTLTAKTSTTIVNYGTKARLSVRLSDLNGALRDKEIVFEKLTSKGWIRFATAKTSNSGECYTAIGPTTKTTYRARFAGAPGYRLSASAGLTMQVRAYVGTPRAPYSAYAKRSFYVYGYLKPRHSAGVKLFCYRYERGKWVRRKTITATNTNYSTYSKYYKRFSLPYRGKWRIRAYHADQGHAARYSGSDFIVIK